VIYNSWAFVSPSIGAAGRIDTLSIRRYNGHSSLLPLIPTHLVYETMEPYTLLVVARTQSWAKRLQSVLDPEEYLIRWVPSATQALKLDLRPSLLLLPLPASGGSRSVARLKHSFHVPLLSLVREGQVPPEQVDASLPHACQLEELVELIETTLINHSPHLVRAGDMCLDTRTRRLQINGELHQLRPIGCHILIELMTHEGSIVPRDELFRRVWRTEDGDSSRALDVHIAYLRRELEANPRNPKLILTERGVGYRLQPRGESK
jgi:DNA-binding response OmpR family regulator